MLPNLILMMNQPLQHSSQASAWCLLIYQPVSLSLSPSLPLFLPLFLSIPLSSTPLSIQPFNFCLPLSLIHPSSLRGAEHLCQASMHLQSCARTHKQTHTDTHTHTHTRTHTHTH